jgi:hypothetical protein
MRKLNRPVLTICIIFGSAFLLAAMGCGPSSSSKSTPAAGIVDQNQNTGGGAQVTEPLVQELPPSQITRECSASEFSQLIAWRNLLNSANAAVDAVKGKKDNATIQSAIAAVQSCDSEIEHHKSQPCRKTTVTRVSTEIKYYDQARIAKDCKKSTDYLVKYNARPIKNTDPIVVTPSEPPTDSSGSGGGAIEPQNPNNGGAVQTSGPYRQCSGDEFAKLTEYSAMQSKADASIKNLGGISNQSSWIYDSNAISNSALTVKSCENLIKYHSVNPCQRSILQPDGSKLTKEYTGESLRARCQTARTYFYEFVQNTKTLIFPNAELYLDFSPLSPKIFEPGFKNQVSGNCLVENRTENTIDYSNHQALIVDTRGFEEKMLIMETAEGLLVQCYGLNVDGPFSKRQIVKVLKEEQSDIRLTYKLK